MSEFRKLQAKLQKIEEGYYKDLDLNLQILRRANPRLSADQLVRLARDQYGQEAATFLNDQLEREAEGDADYFGGPLGGSMSDTTAIDLQPLDEEYEMDMDEVMDMFSKDDIIEFMQDYDLVGPNAVLDDETYRDFADQYARHDVDDMDGEGFYDFLKEFIVDSNINEIKEEEEEDSHDIEPLLNDDEYDMVKRVMAQRGHKPHSLGFDRKGNINAKDDLSVGGPEYVISKDGKLVSLTYGAGYESCPACEGKGRVYDEEGFKQTCETCDGEGQLHTGEPAGEEINPPKQGWMDKFRSVVGEEEEHPSEGRTREMTVDEIHRIGEEDMGLTPFDANTALVRAVGHEEVGIKALYVIAPSGEKLGPFNSLKEVRIDEIDPATGEKFRVTVDNISYVWNVTYEGAREIFQKFIDKEQQQKYKDAEYDWIEKWPGESIEEEVELNEAKTITWLKIPNVRVMPPTRRHRPAIWEGILGTVNAMNDAFEEKYFDYDHDGAKEFAGIEGKNDIRIWRYKEKFRAQWGGADGPRRNQYVLWVEKTSKTVETYVDEDHHPEDPINQQIKSLLAQGKKIISKVPGAIGEIISINDKGFSMVRGGVGAGTDGVNFEAHSNIEIIGRAFQYDIVQHWDDNEIDEDFGGWMRSLPGKIDRKVSVQAAKQANKIVGDVGNQDAVRILVQDKEGGKEIQRYLELYLSEFPTGEYVNVVQELVDALPGARAKWNSINKHPVDEAVVEVPPELRGDTKMTGKATSDDAAQFMADLGPDDDVSHDVVDPETGELLDWPTRATRREQGQAEWEARQAKEKEWNDEGVDVPTLHADMRGDFEDQQEAAWELLDKLRNGDFYNVVWRDASDLVDDPEEMMSKDYDVYVEVPVLLKRKDGAKLVDADHDNIKEIIKAVKAASTMQNVGIGYAGASNEGTTARFYPTFF